MEIPLFKVRASASGLLMCDPKKTKTVYFFDELEIATAKYNKFIDQALQSGDYSALSHLSVRKIETGEVLSETTKTYCREWLTEQIYGYRKEIKNRYLDKGIIMEDDAIDSVISWLDLPFVMKNKDSFEDDYFTGTPDLIIDELDRVDDTKCSWDCFTFPLFDDEIPTMDYFYQLQVYMHLTGKRHASVDYCLMNTPPALDYGEPKDYSKLDKKFRIKSYQFDYDESVIDELKMRIDLCRKYIESLIEKL